MFTVLEESLKSVTKALPYFKKIRCFKKYNLAGLQNELGKVNWSNILLSTDVNYCLNEFICLFNAAVDVVAPFKEVRVRKDSNPWMNATILSGIKERDRLLSRFRKDRNNVSLYSDYCKIRNQVQRDVKMAKENYFKRKVE